MKSAEDELGSIKMFFLFMMTVYNLTSAPNLMMADLHMVPSNAVLLYS